MSTEDDVRGRRWVRGQLVICTCPGRGGRGTVDSARELGQLPLVALGDGEAHECVTAELVSRRERAHGPVASGRPPERVEPVRLADLDPGARDWYRRIPRVERELAVIDALNRAYRASAEYEAEISADIAAHTCEVCGQIRDGECCGQQAF